MIAICQQLNKIFFHLVRAVKDRTIVHLTVAVRGELPPEQLFVPLPEKTGSSFPDPVPNN